MKVRQIQISNSPAAARTGDTPPSRPGRRPTRTIVGSLLIEHRRVLVLLAGLGIAAGSYVLAVALRFDLSLPDDVVPMVLSTLPTVVVCKALGFWLAGLFSGWWRHVSVRDVVDIVRGNVLGSLFFLLAMVFGPGLTGVPRSVFPIDLIICTLVIAGLGIAVRVVRELKTRSAVRRIDTLV
ncbi:MAG TPA: hypothetical protein VKH82_07615, partial [Candidatus Binatia bacterium]|nr:hypothetical protein [Candidatus Binatia bacterium]